MEGTGLCPIRRSRNARHSSDDGTELSASRRELIALLIERGARHHIFSAMCVGDLELIRQVVEQDPDALERRMSRFEQGQTPLHFAINRQRYDILDLLIELGASVDAQDLHGQTALAIAMLRGDREAIRRLHAAGARPPDIVPSSHFAERVAALAATVRKGVPMIYVPDVARALAWYTSIGFKEIARYEDDGVVNFGIISFGATELMLNLFGTPGPNGASLWFYTDDVDGLYQLLKSRQLNAAQAALAGKALDQDAINFVQDIEDMFYGARQFCIQDLNGYALYFIQSE